MSDHLSRFRAVRRWVLAGVAGAIVAAALALGLGLAPAVAEEAPAGAASEPFPPYPEVWCRGVAYPGAVRYFSPPGGFRAAGRRTRAC